MTRDLVLACTAWVDAVRRGYNHPTDRLILAAVAAPTYTNVLVANPFRSGPVLTARRLLGQGEPPLPDGPGRQAQYTPVRVRRRDPAPVAALIRTHQRYSRRLERMASRLRMHEPTVVTSDPFTAAFGDFAWAGPVTYFAYDDWAAHPAFGRWHSSYELAHRRIRERRIRVVAVSGVLLERIAPEGPGQVVPNGVDPEEWRAPEAPPAWFSALGRPRMVYSGVLDQRLDTTALRALATRFASGTIILVGPIGDASALQPIRDLTNVRLVAPVGRPEIVAITSAADVCLIPHRRSALTEAMSPLKLYEYLAAGRPVAATDLPPIRTMRDHVELIEGEDLADAVARALQRPAVTEDERRRFAFEHSWERRMGDLLDLARAPA